MVLVQYQEEYFYFVQNTELNRSEWLKCAKADQIVSLKTLFANDSNEKSKQ